MFFGWKVVWLSLLGSAVFRFEYFGSGATVPMSNPDVLRAEVKGRGFCPCGEVLTRRHQFLASFCVGLYGRPHEIAPEF